MNIRISDAALEAHRAEFRRRDQLIRQAVEAAAEHRNPSKGHSLRDMLDRKLAEHFAEHFAAVS
jgi:hypothetical protein